MQNKLIHSFFAGALVLLAFHARAEIGEQKLPEPLVLKQSRSIEITGGGQNLTAGYSKWRHLTLRGTYETGEHVFQGELAAKKEFDETGTFLGLSDTFAISPDWYASVAAGAGDGAFYLPRYRVDGTINRKWLAKRNLVSSVGLSYYKAPDGHIDHGLTLSAIYYFDSPWVVEGGVRYNRSSPGSIITHQQFVAATFGRDKQDLISGRYAWGGEGYQTIAQNTTLVDFQSREASIAWRHWFNAQSGFLADVNYYHNPVYSRNGANLGFFHQFN